MAPEQSQLLQHLSSCANAANHCCPPFGVLVGLSGLIRSHQRAGMLALSHQMLTAQLQCREHWQGLVGALSAAVGCSGGYGLMLSPVNGVQDRLKHVLSGPQEPNEQTMAKQENEPACMCSPHSHSLSAIALLNCSHVSLSLSSSPCLRSNSCTSAFFTAHTRWHRPWLPHACLMHAPIKLHSAHRAARATCVLQRSSQLGLWHS